jgi:hypothetical protein
MKTVLTGAIAAAVIAVFAGATQAAERYVCQWTGSDWACGDGNVFTQHYPPSAGPPVAIVPVPTVQPTGQRAHEFDAPRPY